MSVLVHSVQVPSLVVFNIAIGFVLVRGIVHLVDKLTDDESSIGCVGVPATILVAAGSLAIWTMAGAW